MSEKVNMDIHKNHYLNNCILAGEGVNLIAYCSVKFSKKSRSLLEKANPLE